MLQLCLFSFYGILLIIFLLPTYSPPDVNPDVTSSEGYSQAPGETESDPPVRAPWPVISGDTEVSSQRVLSAQGDEGGAGDMAAEGTTSAAADHGDRTVRGPTEHRLGA